MACFYICSKEHFITAPVLLLAERDMVPFSTGLCKIIATFNACNCHAVPLFKPVRFPAKIHVSLGRWVAGWLREMGGNQGDWWQSGLWVAKLVAPACYGNSLGSNPHIYQKFKRVP